MILYFTGCPKCKVLKMKLDQKKISYTECNDVEKMEELGISAVPMLQTEDNTLLSFTEAVAYVNSK